MEFAVWVLVAIVALLGLAITSKLSSISKEVTVIRRFLQKDEDLKHISIPANALNIVEQLAESVIRRNGAGT